MAAKARTFTIHLFKLAADGNKAARRALLDRLGHLDDATIDAIIERHRGLNA